MPTEIAPKLATILYSHRPKPFAAELELELTAYELIATCERAEGARPQVELLAGVPHWKFWGMLIVGLGILAGLVAIAIYSSIDRSWFAAGLAVALFAYLSFWMRDYLTRNRPARFRSGAMPSLVLP
jgi:hypothetical protein